MKTEKISYKELKEYFKKNGRHLKGALRDLEDLFIEARDEDGLPIYMTKGRVKKIQSTYLKTKRDNAIKLINDIKDLIGFRIVCLFEQEIYPIHEFILKKHNAEFSIVEMKTFNYLEKDSFERLAGPYKKIFNIDPKPTKDKETGYKSIHYIVRTNKGQGPFVEIQLRTLLQDVWGELEHKLNYKQGSIHPHIKKSFVLLARDLQTNDLLASHLKDIYSKENYFEEYTISSGRVVPGRYFNYEDAKLPSILLGDRIKEKFEEYKRYCEDNFTPLKRDREIIQKGEMMFHDIVRLINSEITNLDRTNDLEYWLKMEQAFYDFASNDLVRIGKAEKAYDEIIEKIEDLKYKEAKPYIPYYRRGEIHLIFSKYAEAISDFDHCENICELVLKNNEAIDLQNLFFVKFYLASTYWKMGEEFIDHSVSKIKEAENIFSKRTFNDEKTKQQNYLTLQNNLCWYHLEKYIITEQKEDLERAEVYFLNLKNSINQKEGDLQIPRNCYDTAAWFCYKAYLFDPSKNHGYLKDAEVYINKALEAELNLATSSLISDALIKNHYQEIMHIIENQKYRFV